MVRAWKLRYIRMSVLCKMVAGVEIFLFLLFAFVFCIEASPNMYCGPANCYDVLGLNSQASTSEIRAAYRKLVHNKPNTLFVNLSFRSPSVLYVGQFLFNHPLPAPVSH